MQIIAMLSALLPIVGRLIDLFTKTPEEKFADVQKSLLAYLSDLDAALKKVKESNGDTSELEKILNSRRK